ncbi:unnamed protein product [Haemonchus placei]|uniref:SSD domain-containing protein n=1 Tax=Haemonchus placei TaxID=6290 RepID=A0A0N4W4W5_HAEPC|nr:unnamed protein product [Haemonchus placei]
MNNFQAVVSQFFETSVVVRWPLPFLVVPPLLTISLISVVATAMDFRLNTTNETLQVFLPDTMQSISDLKELIELFPPRDAQRDSYSIFGSKFASVVLEDVEGNVVSPQGLESVATLHRSIISLKTTKGRRSFSDVCLRSSDGCTLHPLAYAFEDDEPVLSAQFLLRYPMLIIGDLAVDNALVFGGVEKKDNHGNGPIESAKALRIFYLLEPSPEAESWIDAFLEHMAHYHSNSSSRPFWTSSKSLASEMERNSTVRLRQSFILLLPFMPWTAIILLVFCMVACSSRNVVRSQPWIGFFAMLNASMSTVAAMALLLYLRYPFLPLVFIMPFLVVLHFIYSAFKGPPDPLLPFPGVFCTYCAMAILFMFFFQVTFFNAVMVLCCRREIASRHSLFCYRVSRTGKRSMLEISLQNSIYELFRNSKKTDFVMFLFSELPLGLDIKLLAPSGSYLAEFLKAEERLFNEYGTYCFAVVRLQNWSLTNPQERRKLLSLYDDLSRCSTFESFSQSREFWLEEFEKLHDGKTFTSLAFNSALLSLSASKPQFRSDIRYFNPGGDIRATKMLMRIRSLGAVNEKPRAELLRKTMLDSGFDGFVYDTSFLLVDQQLTTVTGVITNVVTAILTMLVICVLMVPRPLSATCIAVSILSINLGVVGALSAAGIRLDIISMITIVMSIGFSVDYVTHTTFHFIVQRNDRLKKCLVVMTEPILQAAMSTVVGVSLLALVPSYIVRTFVMTVFAVVGIGVLHGLLFVPVLLSVMHSKCYYDPEWLLS